MERAVQACFTGASVEHLKRISTRSAPVFLYGSRHGHSASRDLLFSVYRNCAIGARRRDVRLCLIGILA
eukprot:6184071-Pleurochrysis_carterae.AAC.1